MTSTGAPRSDASGAPVVRAFKVLAVVEALSWLILIVATVVKYATTPHKQLAVQIMGPVHGVLFLAYVGLVFVVRRRIDWGARATGIVLLDSILPFGGFVVARRCDLR